MSSSDVNILGGVDKNVAREIQRRREDLGMSRRQLALRAGLDRETVAKAEMSSPGTRTTTVQTLLKTLDDLEHELGSEVSGSDPVEVVELRFGEAAVRGPVRTAEDRLELEESLIRLARRLGLSSDTES